MNTDLPTRDELDATVHLLSAIAHPTRLLVLTALGRSGEHTATELQTIASVEQSTLSHQLRVLREARLVRATRRGRYQVYSLHDHHVAHIVEDALLHVGEPQEPSSSSPTT